MPGNEKSAAATIRSLALSGIDFSVPESDLADWLSNPDFTPYPAIAAALLRLLNGHRFKQPIFIDVIAFNYDATPGVTSPRRAEDVDPDALEKAALDGFNNRYGESVDDFQGIITPLDLPQAPGAGLPQVPGREGLLIEGLTKVQNGIALADTDNPQIVSTIKLITVHADWAQGDVPQEFHRHQLGWQFQNGYAEFSVSDGEANAKRIPTRAGSLNDGAHAWPASEGDFSGAAAATVSLVGRIRIGYKPVSVKLLISGPRGYASNTNAPFRVALDPEILLVPIEVARFFSPDIPVSWIDARNQMALWDQVPMTSGTGDFKNTDGHTGELKSSAGTWDVWPTPAPPEGLYTHQGWVSPDSIWGKAKIRFRLVNYIDIPTDNEHTSPTGGGMDDTRLRENRDALKQHPQHIRDKNVVSVIFMHRIAPPDAPEIGRALISESTIGIAAGARDRFATIAHEIGHLITGSQAHNNLPNNIMNDPGPGTDVTAEQIARARVWAQNFASFWQHP